MEEEQDLTLEDRIINFLWRVPARVAFWVCYLVSLFFMVLVCIRSLLRTPARKGRA